MEPTSIKRTTAYCVIACCLVVAAGCAKAQRAGAGRVVTVAGVDGQPLQASPSPGAKRVAIVPFGAVCEVAGPEVRQARPGAPEGIWLNARCPVGAGWLFSAGVKEGDHAADARQVADIRARMEAECSFQPAAAYRASAALPRFDRIVLIARSVDAFCFSEPNEWVETISLETGSARYVLSGQFGFEHRRIEQAGSYRVLGDRIQVDLREGTRLQDNLTDPGDSSRVRERAYSFSLFWVVELNGFMRDGDLRALRNRQFHHDRREHYLIERQHELNRRLCAVDNAFAESFSLIGYFRRKK